MNKIYVDALKDNSSHNNFGGKRCWDVILVLLKSISLFSVLCVLSHSLISWNFSFSLLYNNMIWGSHFVTLVDRLKLVNVCCATYYSLVQVISGVNMIMWGSFLYVDIQGTTYLANQCANKCGCLSNFKKYYFSINRTSFNGCLSSVPPETCLDRIMI